VFTALGNGLITPSITGLLSQAVTMREQGRVQGGNQSVQALGRVLGPLWGGTVYGKLGPSAPYLSGAVGLTLAVLTVIAAIPRLEAHRGKAAEAAVKVEESAV
jgi:DHA1 family tetracycline resistance protein-like MFS transporter